MRTMNAARENVLRAALVTPPGEGGISVILLAGPGAAAFVESRVRGPKGNTKKVTPGRLVYGFFHSASGAPLDEVIIACRDDGYVEINCHGGIVPARRILESLRDYDANVEADAARVVTEGLGAIEREAFQALTSANTELAAKVFAAQLGGLLAAAVEEVVRDIAAGAPDFKRAKVTLRRLLESANLGLALAGPKTVAVIGPPNAGKSTLVNVFAGFERNIVTDVPGTTRDAVSVPVSIFGVPMTLVDTGGFDRLPRVERRAIDCTVGSIAEESLRRAVGAMKDADVLMVVIDASTPLPRGWIPSDAVGRAVVAANKADLAPNAETLSEIDSWKLPVVRTSGVTGEGIAELKEALLAALEIPVPDKAAATRAVIFTERQFHLAKSALAALERGDAAGAKKSLGDLAAK